MKFLIAFLSACLSLPALAITAAPGYTTIMGTQVVDASGAPLASGTATFRVVDAGGHPMSVKLGPGGQVITAPVSVQVVNGAFTAQVLDVSQSAPSFPCVQLQIINNADGSTVWSDNCLQPSGGTYSLDNFSTNTTPVKPAAGDTISGDLGVVGNLSVTGNLNLGGFTVQNMNATNLNGVTDAALFAGSDIGAKVNAAFALSSTGTTVFIPAGSYSFSTTIQFPNARGYHLKCDAAATLTYTGSGSAIAFTTIGQAQVGVDGDGGCLLQSATKGQGTGIDFHGTNQTFVTGMRIVNFNRGIYAEGANTVEILNNTFQGNTRAIDEITIPGFAPNAIHVSFNEFIQNGWAVYSENGGVSASHALGNVYSHNTFEEDTSGDLWLAWDAQTEVAYNYFESPGVEVAIGEGLDNVYNVRVHNNYFTVSAALRSEIELGYSLEAEISDNFEEGAVGASSGCRINVVSGPNGGAGGTMIDNPWNVHMEGANHPPTTYDLCSHGTPTNNLGGNYVFDSAVAVNQNLSVQGNASFANGLATNGASFNGTTTAVNVGGTCIPEGGTLVNTNSPAHMYFCSAGFWRQVY